MTLKINGNLAGPCDSLGR